MLNVQILATHSLVDGKKISTKELIEKCAPEREADELEKKIGIQNRYWMPPETSFAEFGARSLRESLIKAKLEAKDLSRVIFVNSTGGDYLVPATFNVICEKLGIIDTCDGFDLNNACVGFLTAFDIAARGVATGSGPVAIVMVELFSNYIDKSNPRPYLVFGDVAVSVIVGKADKECGIVSSHFMNMPQYINGVTLGHGGLTGKREIFQFNNPSDDFIQITLDGLTRCIDKVLDVSGQTLDEIEWIVLHQPNGRMLEVYIEHLGISRRKVPNVVNAVGSIGSASMPAGLDKLLTGSNVRSGDRILMAGIGAGLSTGTVLYKV
ncbi:MAG: 3-oxoacyl-[acyl-carrier-protein] synthase III C-terminal domain-containing protein [bacterium]|nr:ketoacyl-ACP synthase III [bacterium]MBU1918976.1 ketoacyl-ACP synthase III [bacterium]